MSARRWRRVGPWAIPVLVTAEVCLVWSGRLGLQAAVLVGVVIETALWSSALVGAGVGLASYRQARTSGVDAWRAAEEGLAALVPRLLARALLLEARLWVCLARWALGRHPGRHAGALAYHRQIGPLLAGAVALVVVEGAVVDTVLMVALPGSAWAWVVLGVHVYGVIFLAGLYASFVTRPHVVTADRILLRDGVFHEIELPRRAVLSARVERRANVGRSGFTYDADSRTALLALGDATAALDLDPTVPLLLDGTPAAVRPHRLAITADNPDRLVRALQPGPANADRPASSGGAPPIA